MRAPRAVRHLRLIAPLGHCLALGVLLATATFGAGAAERRVALLVGVGQYADTVIPALEGPVHDLAAVRSALQSHWQFKSEDIEVLQDAAATRQGILAGLARLESRSAPGDQVFLYFSGHGTSANDRATELPLPHSSGAFIPFDLRTDQPAQGMVAQLIVGQRDLQPLLRRLDAGGRQVFVVSDSCYSGQAVRALGARADGARLTPRFVPLQALAAGPGAARPASRALRPEPPPYPYRQVFYIAAASDSEVAMDIGSRDLKALPTIDGRPHGALTDALLRALTGDLPVDANRDGLIEHAELYAAIGAFMARRGYSHTPQSLPSTAEDPARLAQAPLFGLRGLGRVGSPALAPGPAATAPGPLPALAGSAPIPPGAAVAVAAVAAPVMAPASASQASSQAAQAAAPPVAALRVRLSGEAAAAREALQAADGLVLDSEAAADFSLAAATAGWQLRGPAGDLVLQGTLPQVQRRLEAAVWLRRLQGLAAARQAFTLSLQALPSTRGGSFVEGERFNLALRSPRLTSVLLLAVDPQGSISLLYPYNAREKAPHPADALVLTPPPGQGIVVTPPFGTDELWAVAFEQTPAFWGRLPHTGRLTLGDPLLAALEAALKAPGGIGSAGLLIRALPALR